MVGRRVTDLQYVDDIILIACSEAQLQELVDRRTVSARRTIC